MAEFVKPFPGMVPQRKMTERELVRAIRLNIAAELEATHLYTAHADATDNEFAKRVLNDIAHDEQVHSYQFIQLLQTLEPDEVKYQEKASAETIKIACELIPDSNLCRRTNGQKSV